MTTREAVKTARQRWGINGDAWQHWSAERGIVCRVGVWTDVPRYVGEGATWEDAFKNAEKNEFDDLPEARNSN